jgi:hypothetical protein
MPDLFAVLLRTVHDGRVERQRVRIRTDGVKTHLGSVQRKVCARDRTEIAVWAWESGLVR